MKRNLFFILVLLSACMHIYGQVKTARTVDLVYPLLDAANSRWFYFSSASRPFGMVSLFPDNQINGDWNGGYRYNVDTIKCFSHIHEWQLSGVPVLPVTFKTSNLTSLLSDFSSPFSHEKEVVKPGYHSVVLNRYGITAELTASNRVGLHRYTFPEGEKQGIVFQLKGVLGASELIEGGFVQVSASEIRGYMINGKTGRRPKVAPVYFSAVFNHPVKKIYLLQEGKLTEGLKEWKGAGGTMLVELDNKGRQVSMNVGLSFTSATGAAKNRKAEVPAWNFDQVKTQASNHWNSMLSRISVEGGTLKQQRRFYTDLWKAIQGRRMLNDVDGKYSDFTGNERLIKQVALNAQGKPKFNMYNSDSFWGAQWTLNTLWSLVYPEVVEDFCNSFLQYYKDGGLIPRGPSGGNYTAVMTGAQTTPFYVSAWFKGIRGFDIDLAYEGLKKNHMPGGMMGKVGYEHNTARGGGIEEYIARGYVPYPLSDTVYGMHQDGAAITLENAYQDWCLAQLAKSLKKEADYQYFKKRSGNFSNLYNAKEGYMVPKDWNGKWKSPFDPLLNDNGFEEASGAQYTWFVPHDMKGLFNLLGGEDQAVKKLNQQFLDSRAYRFASEHPLNLDVIRKERRTWVNYSNQPNMQTVFIFNHAGAPWLTQQWSREVLDSAYSDLSPQFGYNGDEDQGLMGALNVLMKIGLFQMTGGCEEDPVYEIGSPIFSKTVIHLNPKYYKSKQFTILASNISDRNIYIQSAKLGVNPLIHFYFYHSDINAGKTLQLYMGSTPGTWAGLKK
ncbi:GH92 family glycosyl hydrolase [Pedobacter sp. P351]|uniref:GH92 family glycosyl hydrolase n=1 Tax=Pedobacter superstes TaxID=3133441 RepID=UPI0030AE5B29